MSTLTLLLTTTILALAPQAKPRGEAPTDVDADEAALTSSDGNVSVYDFADEKLTGEHLSPDGTLIPWRQPAHHSSLIDLRGHFTPELVRLSLDL
jgi:hypothetical protein